MKWWTASVVAAVVGSFALAPIGAGATPGMDAEPRRAKTTIPGDGTYRIGIDVRPGTYVSRSTGSFGGYWERLSCATGAFDCILANDNIEGQTFVTIESTDTYFSTSRMGTWKRA